MLEVNPQPGFPFEGKVAQLLLAGSEAPCCHGVRLLSGASHSRILPWRHITPSPFAQVTL